MNLIWGNFVLQTQNSRTEVILLYTIAVVYSLYTFRPADRMKRHFFCLGNVSERDMSGRYETPHWNLSIQPSNDLWIDFELILCDEQRTPKRKSCLLYSIEYIFRPADRMKRHFFLLSLGKASETRQLLRTSFRSCPLMVSFDTLYHDVCPFRVFWLWDRWTVAL